MPNSTLDAAARDAFCRTVKDYYLNYGRHDLAWRQPHRPGEFDPYRIMVSELMLQQTQVSRVTPKYIEFLERFPSAMRLAKAPLGDVLRAWGGLGYNRRAKFLHQAAQSIVKDHAGKFPRETAALVKLPGIGANTAGAIAAYAFNQPAVFIETNIRTVFLHHFYPDKTNIADKDILVLMAAALDREQPREWYWALMDYGAYLKRTLGNLNSASHSYVKQSKFAGSRRAVRGHIIKLLTSSSLAQSELGALIDDERFDDVLNDLVSEGLVLRNGQQLRL